MRRSTLGSLLVLAADLAAQQVDWHGSLQAARRAAFASGKPVLAVFRCEP